MRVVVLSDQEYSVFKEKLVNFPPRIRAIISLMLFCGLRNSEVCSLNFEDVFVSEFVRNSVFIAAMNSKSGVSREVDLPGQVKDAMRCYYDWVKSYGKTALGSGPLFFTLVQRIRITPRDVQNFVYRYTVEVLNVRHHPHTLRHTYATQLLKFTNIRVVQALLGHKSITSTAIYLHPTSAECAEAVGRAFPCTNEKLIPGKGGCNHG